ncbi:MAG: four helix bundle protein [Chloroflexi bacterium HGW-Chloroflexi-3]|nr:MAG: four helix bundle protein [Chloroflexi bacterium HGW-Chloroflexi-3]
MTDIAPEKTLSTPQPYQLPYKDLIVWQKSIEFACNVIDHAENLASNRKHYRLVEQLEAAATSIPMNIAEGKGRYSTKELKHFLMIARGSLYETMTLLEIFKQKSWIPEKDFLQLTQQAIEISKLITAFHRNLKVE